MSPNRTLLKSPDNLKIDNLYYVKLLAGSALRVTSSAAHEPSVPEPRNPACRTSPGVVDLRGGVGRNRDSVPCEFPGQMLSTRLYPGRVVVVGDDAIVAEHEGLADERSGALRLAALHPADPAQARRTA
jgi:hypothetical protein